jgi:hypothetical protein
VQPDQIRDYKNEAQDPEAVSDEQHNKTHGDSFARLSAVYSRVHGRELVGRQMLHNPQDWKFGGRIAQGIESRQRREAVRGQVEL